MKKILLCQLSKFQTGTHFIRLTVILTTIGRSSLIPVIEMSGYHVTVCPFTGNKAYL